MVLARSLEDWLEKRRKRRDAEVYAEAHAEGYAEGRAEEHARWVAWNERRIAAKKDNKPFNEPPPGPPDECLTGAEPVRATD